MADSAPYQLRRSRVGHRQPVSTNFDIHLAIPVLLLVAFGIAMVFSASYPRNTGDAFSFVKRQALFACIGISLCTLIWRLRRDLLVRLAYPAYALSIFLLMVVLVVGRDINGARSWIPIGPFNLQPSEMAKVTLILGLAKLLTDHPESIRSLKSMVPAFLMIGAVCVFILLGKDFGTMFVAAVAGFIMLFLAGARIKHLLQVGGPVTLMVVGLICMEPYRLDRIRSFINPEDHLQTGGYQIFRGLIAIGSGGLSGVGFSRSREKFSYLPEPHTDTIFAVIGEELGLVFCLAVVMLFFWIGWRGFKIAKLSRDRFSALGAAGMTNLILIGAATNLLVITGMIPPTGLPLTFISYGGSSLIFSLITIGILANLSRHIDPDDELSVATHHDGWRDPGVTSTLGAEVVARTLKPRGM